MLIAGSRCSLYSPCRCCAESINFYLEDYQNVFYQGVSIFNFFQFEYHRDFETKFAKPLYFKWEFLKGVDEDIIQIIFFPLPFLGLQENFSDFKKYIPWKRGKM